MKDLTTFKYQKVVKSTIWSHERFDNFLKVVKSTSNLFFIPSMALIVLTINIGQM